MTNEEVCSRIQDANGMHDDLSLNLVEETETQVVWPHLKILWHSAKAIIMNSAWESERSKRKAAEEMGIQHQRMDMNGVWRFPEGDRRQGKLQR